MHASSSASASSPSHPCTGTCGSARTRTGTFRPLAATRAVASNIAITRSGASSATRRNSIECSILAARCRASGAAWRRIYENGARRPIGSSDVNDYLREASGGSFTAKDFRTWFATVEALALLRKARPGNTNEAKKQVLATVKAVSARLGNTPAICRKCYIHPEVLSAHEAGRLRFSEWRQRPARASQAAGSLAQLPKQSEESYVSNRERHREATACADCGGRHPRVRIGRKIRNS